MANKVESSSIVGGTQPTVVNNICPISTQPDAPKKDTKVVLAERTMEELHEQIQNDLNVVIATYDKQRQMSRDYNTFNIAYSTAMNKIGSILAAAEAAGLDRNSFSLKKLNQNTDTRYNNVQRINGKWICVVGYQDQFPGDYKEHLEDDDTYIELHHSEARQAAKDKYKNHSKFEKFILSYINHHETVIGDIITSKYSEFLDIEKQSKTVPERQTIDDDAKWARGSRQARKEALIQHDLKEIFAGGDNYQSKSERRSEDVSPVKTFEAPKNGKGRKELFEALRQRRLHMDNKTTREEFFKIFPLIRNMTSMKDVKRIMIDRALGETDKRVISCLINHESPFIYDMEGKQPYDFIEALWAIANKARNKLQHALNGNTNNAIYDVIFTSTDSIATPALWVSDLVYTNNTNRPVTWNRAKLDIVLFTVALYGTPFEVLLKVAIPTDTSNPTFPLVQSATRFYYGYDLDAVTFSSVLSAMPLNFDIIGPITVPSTWKITIQYRLATLVGVTNAQWAVKLFHAKNDPFSSFLPRNDRRLLLTPDSEVPITINWKGQNVTLSRLALTLLLREANKIGSVRANNIKFISNIEQVEDGDVLTVHQRGLVGGMDQYAKNTAISETPPVMMGTMESTRGQKLAEAQKMIKSANFKLLLSDLREIAEGRDDDIVGTTALATDQVLNNWTTYTTKFKSSISNGSTSQTGGMFHEDTWGQYVLSSSTALNDGLQLYNGPGSMAGQPKYVPDNSEVYEWLGMKFSRKCLASVLDSYVPPKQPEYDTDAYFLPGDLANRLIKYVVKSTDLTESNVEASSVIFEYLKTLGPELLTNAFAKSYTQMKEISDAKFEGQALVRYINNAQEEYIRRRLKHFNAYVGREAFCFDADYVSKLEDMNLEDRARAVNYILALKFSHWAPIDKYSIPSQFAPEWATLYKAMQDTTGGILTVSQYVRINTSLCVGDAMSRVLVAAGKNYEAGQVGSMSFPLANNLLYLCQVYTFPGSTTENCIANQHIQLNASTPADTTFVLTGFDRLPFTQNVVVSSIQAYVIDTNQMTSIRAGTSTLITLPLGWTMDQWGNSVALVPVTLDMANQPLTLAAWTLMFMAYPYKLWTWNVSLVDDNNTPIGATSFNIPSSASMCINVDAPTVKVLYVLINATVPTNSDMNIFVGRNFLTAISHSANNPSGVSVDITAALDSLWAVDTATFVQSFWTANGWWYRFLGNQIDHNSAYFCVASMIGHLPPLTYAYTSSFSPGGPFFNTAFAAANATVPPWGNIGGINTFTSANIDQIRSSTSYSDLLFMPGARTIASIRSSVDTNQAPRHLGRLDAIAAVDAVWGVLNFRVPVEKAPSTPPKVALRIRLMASAITDVHDYCISSSGIGLSELVTVGSVLISTDTRQFVKDALTALYNKFEAAVNTTFVHLAYHLRPENYVFQSLWPVFSADPFVPRPDQFFVSNRNQLVPYARVHRGRLGRPLLGKLPDGYDIPRLVERFLTLNPQSQPQNYEKWYYEWAKIGEGMQEKLAWISSNVYFQPSPQASVGFTFDQGQVYMDPMGTTILNVPYVVGLPSFNVANWYALFNFKPPDPTFIRLNGFVDLPVYPVMPQMVTAVNRLTTVSLSSRSRLYASLSRHQLTLFSLRIVSPSYEAYSTSQFSDHSTGAASLLTRLDLLLDF